jgi:hypothetical protein
VKWLQRLWILGTSRHRAERLLMDFLTPQQRDDYRSLGVFIVRSQLGHNYLIGPGTLIRRLERNEKWEWYFKTSYCFVPSEGCRSIPEPDSMLATAVWLSCDELTFLQTAIVRIPEQKPRDWRQFIRARLLLATCAVQTLVNSRSWLPSTSKVKAEPSPRNFGATETQGPDLASRAAQLSLIPDKSQGWRETSDERITN